MSRATFGLEAGSPNYAQGGVHNRFKKNDDAWRSSRGELIGTPMMIVHPTYAPYSWAWSRKPSESVMQPEDAIAAGSFESYDRDLWGDNYYGYKYYAAHGHAEFENASYATVPFGGDPENALFDPNQWYAHESVPNDAFVSGVGDDASPWEQFLQERGMGHKRGRAESSIVGRSAYAVSQAGSHHQKARSRRPEHEGTAVTHGVSHDGNMSGYGAPGGGPDTVMSDQHDARPGIKPRKVSAGPTSIFGHFQQAMRSRKDRKTYQTGYAWRERNSVWH